jgi:mutator protein MutT
MEHQQPLDCVAFIVLAANQVLAEKRALTKRVVPGALALPGGHMEAGESPEAALRREVLEELGVVATRATQVCTLLHQSEELRRLHYFAVEEWDGEIQCREAEALIWIPVGELHRLDLDADRVAVEQYVRGTLFQGPAVNLGSEGL